MHPRKHLIMIVAGLLVLLGFGYLLLRPSAPADSLAASAPSRAPKATAVRTVMVYRGMISQHLTGTGDILAQARVDVFPKIAGHLRELRIEAGDRVHAGQLIAQIVDDALRAEVARMRAQVDALRAEWAQMQAGARPGEIAQAVDQVEHARAELSNAEWMLERTRTMVNRGVQSAQDLEETRRHVTQAKAAHRIAQSQLDLLRAGARAEERQALQARLRAAQAALHVARVELQHATIRAPMDGIIGYRHVDPGAYVTTTDTPIVTLVAMDTVKIRVPISERDMDRVRPGLSARIAVDAYPDETFAGAIERVSPLIDPTSRSGEVEIRIANRDHRLKPGMFAEVTIIVQQREDVVVVPPDALQIDGPRAEVFVVQDGMAQRRHVSIGLQTATQVEVLDTLEPGTEIVLVGHQGLKDQDPVRVVKTNEKE